LDFRAFPEILPQELRLKEQVRWAMWSITPGAALMKEVEAERAIAATPEANAF
jgi:hypothetical protein